MTILINDNPICFDWLKPDKTLELMCKWNWNNAWVPWTYLKIPWASQSNPIRWKHYLPKWFTIWKHPVDKKKSKKSNLPNINNKWISRNPTEYQQITMNIPYGSMATVWEGTKNPPNYSKLSSPTSFQKVWLDP